METIATNKLDTEQLIPLLKQRADRAKDEMLVWMDRCRALEIELLRKGWAEEDLHVLYRDCARRKD